MEEHCVVLIHCKLHLHEHIVVGTFIELPALRINKLIIVKVAVIKTYFAAVENPAVLTLPKLNHPFHTVVVEEDTACVK